jgi:putative ABC transport system permease protein
MDDVLARHRSKPRFMATILGLFGFLALALTATGVFGVMAYTVRARRHEFGVRMALGADSNSVVRLVLRRGGRLVLLGLLIGLMGSVWVTRVLASVLYEVKPLDPATFVYVCLLMIGVATAANYIPARRATKIDAWVVLRSE